MKNDYEIRGEVTAIFLNYKGEQLETIISTSDLEKAKSFPHKWAPHWSDQTNTFYVGGHSPTKNGRRETVYLNKWITNTTDSMCVENIDKDTLNNQRSNIRIIPKANKNQNRRGANKNGSTGVRGVSWNKNSKKFYAHLTVNYKRISVGYFDSLQEAEKAVIESRKKYMPYAIEKEESK